MRLNITQGKWQQIRGKKRPLAHLKEFPDYYTRLSAMEKEADEYWANG